MKRVLFSAIALLVALSPIQADAQLNGVPAPQEYLDFLSGSGVVSRGLTSSVYVGPYSGEFEASAFRSVASNRFALYCVDYAHSARTGAAYLVDVYGLGGDVGSLSTTRIGDQSTYVRLAYLSSLFDDYQGTSGQRSAWSALHAAIWQVSSNSDVLASNAYVNDMYEQFYNMDVPATFSADGWYVVSDAEGRGQEFLVRRSVPEPATILLMLSGLVMLVGVNRKRILAIQDI